MAKASKGTRVGTRQKYRKRVRQRGLSPITRALQRFAVGERATIVVDPSIHGGQPHHRFHGMTGVVVGQQGRAYVLDVRFGNKTKRAIVAPEHLRKEG